MTKVTTIIIIKQLFSCMLIYYRLFYDYSSTRSTNLERLTVSNLKEQQKLFLKFQCRFFCTGKLELFKVHQILIETDLIMSPVNFYITFL
jgi:ABC-type transport system involved in cytochrome c biogenesis permease component